jgi:hypothetical protein
MPWSHRSSGRFSLVSGKCLAAVILPSNPVFLSRQNMLHKGTTVQLKIYGRIWIFLDNLWQLGPYHSTVWLLAWLQGSKQALRLDICQTVIETSRLEDNSNLSNTHCTGNVTKYYSIFQRSLHACVVVTFTWQKFETTILFQGLV